MDTAPTTYSNAQCLFGVQHPLMAAFMHGFPFETRRWPATKISPVSARLEIAHTRSHKESFSP